MKSSHTMFIWAISACLLCAAGSTSWAQASPDPACEAITPEAMDAYAKMIDGALQWANQDAAANGASGAYAVAANNSRDFLNSAEAKARDAAAFLRRDNPAATSYAEAGQLRISLRDILKAVPSAADWALISTVYHKSEDAKRAFEASIGVLHHGHELLANAGRCYMNPYLAEADETAAGAGLIDVGAPLLMHLTFDGPLENLGSIPETPLLFVKEGDANPASVAGKHGQALHFDSNSAVVLPFELDLATMPQITVTAWVKQDAGARDTRAILHAGSAAGFSFGINGGNVSLMPGNVSAGVGGRLPDDEWVFVAGVVDMNTGVARVHQNDKMFTNDSIRTGTKPPYTYPNLLDPDVERSAYLNIGSYSFYPWGGATRSMAIDDVRLYAAALSVDQVNAIRIGETEKNDPVVDAGIIPPNGPVAIPGPGDAIDGSSDDFLPGGSSGETGGDMIPGGLIVMPEPGDAIDDSADDILPGGTIGPSEEPLQPDSAPSESVAGEPYAIGDIGEAQFSAIAGWRGETTEIIDLGSYFLNQISWQEKNDRPCLIRASYMTNQNRDVVVTETRSACISPTGWQTVGLDESIIGSIDVCSSNSTRLKGMRIFGDRINSDGSLKNILETAEATRPNCRGDWSGAKLCPTETLASGVVVHWGNTTNNNKIIVGLQLICKRVGLR